MINIELVWPDCNSFGLYNNGGADDVFLVEGRYDELTDMIRSHFGRNSEKAAEILIAFEMCYLEQLTSDTLTEGKKSKREDQICCLVSRHLQLIKPMPYGYPYSEQWLDGNPFQIIFPQYVFYLEDIQKIDSSPVKITTLPVWKGSDEFQYIGSVERGIVLIDGNRKRINLRPSLFANILNAFDGQTITVKASAKDTSRNNLGVWLRERFDNAAVVQKVAAILVAEGLAEKVSDKNKISIVKGIRLELDHDSVKEHVMPQIEVIDANTGEKTEFEGIDGKTLWHLEAQGRALYKRIKEPEGKTKNGRANPVAEVNTAEVGFEKQLWESANILRGNIDASDYKHVVLGLIFLKYISDKFDERYTELVAEGESFEEDLDEYLSKGVFYVPYAARWASIAAAAHTPDIGKVIDEAMQAIEKENKRLRGVLPKNFARPELDKRRLGDVVDLFTNISMIAHGDSKDVLGRAYEYCLSKFAEQEGKLAGEFYTPACVVRTLVEVLKPYNGRVYDIITTKTIQFNYPI